MIETGRNIGADKMERVWARVWNRVRLKKRIWVRFEDGVWGRIKDMEAKVVSRVWVRFWAKVKVRVKAEEWEKQF